MVSHESDTWSLLVTSHHKNEQDNGKMDCVIFKSLLELYFLSVRSLTTPLIMYQCKCQSTLCQYFNGSCTGIRQQNSLHIHEVTFLFINSISSVKKRNSR